MSNETETEMLEPGIALEGKQKTVGTVVASVIKTIPATEGRESFRILELTIGNLRGRVREILGDGTLRVGLSAGNITLQSRIGRIAKGLFGWNGKTRINPNDFKGQDLEFYVEPVEQENGTFWNINRNSIGIVGHIHDEPVAVAAEADNE